MLSRVQAETVLRPHSEGSYLVRQVFPASNSSNSSEASGKTSGRQDASSRDSGNFSRSNQDLGRMDYSLAIKYVLPFFTPFTYKQMGWILFHFNNINQGSTTLPKHGCHEM